MKIKQDDNGKNILEETIADELVHVTRNDLVCMKFQIKKMQKMNCECPFIIETGKLIAEIENKYKEVENRLKEKPK